MLEKVTIPIDGYASADNGNDSVISDILTVSELLEGAVNPGVSGGPIFITVEKGKEEMCRQLLKDANLIIFGNKV